MAVEREAKFVNTPELQYKFTVRGFEKIGREVVDRIQRQATSLGFEIVRQDPRRHEDTYYDTPEGTLGSREAYLRVRTSPDDSNQSPRLTLKTQVREQPGGIHVQCFVPF